jgi:hypothetical protein
MKALWQDNSVHGEDWQVSYDMGQYKSLDLVIDGVSRKNGKKAVDIFSTIMKEVPTSKAALKDQIQTAHEQMLSANAASTLLAAYRSKTRVTFLMAGDGAVIYQLNDKVDIYQEDDGNMGISNALGHGRYKPKEKIKLLELEFEVSQHSKLILVTDGIAAHCPYREYEKILKSPTAQQAMTSLQTVMTEIKNGTRSPQWGTFNPDDMTATIRYFS